MADSRHIAAEVKRIIAEQLEVEPSQVQPEANFTDDLLADSLMLVELRLALNSALKVSISDDTAEGLHTVQDVITYIQRHAK